MKLLIGMACFALLAMISVKAYSFEINGRYLNYGNGMINLDNVTHIDPQIRYVVTMPEDQWRVPLSPKHKDQLDDFKEYRTSDMRRVAVIVDVLTWFNPDNLKDLDYYYLEIEGYIKFDNFILTMVPKQTYLKLPSGHDRDRIRTTHREKVTRFFEHIKQFLGSEDKPASRLSKSDSDKISERVYDMITSY